MAEDVEIIDGVHDYIRDEQSYIAPDENIRTSLSRWQDLKLGFMVHWGAYSQWGIVESWALSDDDSGWSRAHIALDGAEIKRRYPMLPATFNPVLFRPDDWAQAALEGGFRYFIFTTKHHDGFSMYDTKFSDYKITSPRYPFHSHPYADITRCLFDAFRSKGIRIGVYFSKPDWHCEHYWEPGKPSRSPSRGPTYNPLEDAEKWNRYKAYTHSQIGELMSSYGAVDILWLDGGWVNPRNDGQDLDMRTVAENARKEQPGLIIVDRTVGGEYENYITPEQTIPKTPLFIPWEACITLGTSFSYKNDDAYKSKRQLIHMLIDVVAKGGNLVLNAGAQPNGKLPAPALERMRAIGGWLARFGEAIYDTKPVPPYLTGNIGFTANANRTYAIRTLSENEEVKELIFPYAKPVQSVAMPGRDAPLRYTRQNGILCVEIPELTEEEKIAFAIRME